MKFDKPLHVLRLFFRHKVPWWMRIVRPVVVSAALLFGMNQFLLPNLPGRSLTPGERRMLAATFKDSIDYDKVRVHHSKLGDLVRMAARADMATWGSTIVTGSDTTDFSAKDVQFMPRYAFTHEIAHVWQNQNHVSEKFSQFAARQKIKLPGAEQLSTYQYRLKQANDLIDFNVEQQASVVTDYTFLVKPEDVFKKNVQSPLDADTFADAAERKASYERVLKNFITNPAYPRRR